MEQHKFSDKASLENELASSITEKLKEAIRLKGSASILFSGGSTPKGLLGKLATSDFDWSAVKVGLVDDRMVPPNSEDLNANMIRDLFVDKIEGSRPAFYPLVPAWDDRSMNIELAMNTAIHIGTPDVVILGMGGDGHFASLFPNDEASSQGLSLKENSPLMYTQAPVFPKSRISHTWSYLRSARSLIIHITGESKLELLEQSEHRSAPLPIDTVLNDNGVNPELYWAP